MTQTISSKLLSQTFQRNIFSFISIKKHVNTTSSAYHTVCFRRHKEKKITDNTFIKNHPWKTLCRRSTPLCINFQIRNISNETSASKNIGESSNVQSEMIHDEAINDLISNLPTFLKNVSDWKIVELAQQSLLKVHETTGLPWWASIALTAFIARTVVTLPFSIITVRNSAKLEMVRSEMDEVVKRLKQEANYACQFHHWPEHLARREYNKAVKREYKEMIVRENCHPGKNFILIWIQIPLWFAYSFATRNLCYMLPQPDLAAQITFMEMTVGGFAWISNLAIPDPYIILPILLGVMNIAVIEVHRLFKTTPPRRIERWLTNIFRLISILLIPIASYLPAATNIYWITSSTFSLLQAFILHSTKLRRICDIPVVKSELEHPYRQFYSNLKSKL